jgi:macrodomain Ter protein organizer (MatP/YcbG family)
VLPARVTQATYDELNRALTDERAQRWFELETVDSKISIDLSQVVYVRIDTEAQRVGF